MVSPMYGTQVSLVTTYQRGTQGRAMPSQGSQHGGSFGEERFLQAGQEGKEPAPLRDAETKTIHPLNVILQQVVHRGLGEGGQRSSSGEQETPVYSVNSFLL